MRPFEVSFFVFFRFSDVIRCSIYLGLPGPYNADKERLTKETEEYKMFRKLFTTGLDNYRKAHWESAFVFTEYETKDL